MDVVVVVVVVWSLLWWGMAGSSKHLHSLDRSVVISAMTVLFPPFMPPSFYTFPHNSKAAYRGV
jgi:hypothetical protein